VIAEPPAAVVYQRYCPFTPPLAPIVIDDPAHAELEIAVGAAGSAVTVSVTVSEKASNVLSPDTLQR
jgi:hypothetical protein